MPTYEYKCNGCEATVEIFQQITENPKRKCPECGKLRLKRQIGMGGGIIFRGEGFHCNDYGKKDKTD